MIHATPKLQRLTALKQWRKALPFSFPFLTRLPSTFVDHDPAPRYSST